MAEVGIWRIALNNSSRNGAELGKWAGVVDYLGNNNHKISQDEVDQYVATRTQAQLPVDPAVSQLGAEIAAAQNRSLVVDALEYGALLATHTAKGLAYHAIAAAADLVSFGELRH